MSDFSEDFARLVASDDRDGMRNWMTEMMDKIRYTEPPQDEVVILRRRIRILKDYLKDDEASERDI